MDTKLSYINQNHKYKPQPVRGYNSQKPQWKFFKNQMKELNCDEPIKQQWIMKRPEKMERHNLSMYTKTSLLRTRFCLN